MDLRQALYSRAAGQSEEIAVHLRDYTARSSGKPDPQRLYFISKPYEAERLLELHSGENPAQLLRNPAGGLLMVASGTPAEGKGTIPITLLQVNGSEIKRIGLLRSDLLPLGFNADNMPVMLPLKTVTLERGLLALAPDWAAKALLLDLATLKLSENDLPLFASGPDGFAAGYSIVHDPAAPQQATIKYFWGGSGSKPAEGFSLPYFLDASGPRWRPPLCLPGDKTLATLSYLPNASGLGNAQDDGIFRLVEYEAKSGAEGRLIEDHLAADLPVHCMGGTLFYSRMAPGDDSASWQVWAASADGMHKRLLYSSEGAVYVSVEDAFEGRRLLLHRQYIEMAEGSPKLLGEVIELSLDALAPGMVTLPEPVVAEGAAVEPAPLEDGPGFIPDRPIQPLPDGDDDEDGGGGNSLPPLQIPD